MNWVLDLDIKSFFDGLSHEWLIKFVEHRVADRRVVRLIQKWLNAGVLEDGKRIRVEEGTPQGGSASPLLANVYLHYVFDLWVQAWRQKRAHGDVIVVRFADDIVVGFNSRADADQFRAELTERMKKFNLELHPEKTRLLEFGPFAIDQREWRGEGKPETFVNAELVVQTGKRLQKIKKPTGQALWRWVGISSWLNSISRDSASPCQKTHAYSTYSSNTWRRSY